jgi:hypothetical protein
VAIMMAEEWENWNTGNCSVLDVCRFIWRILYLQNPACFSAYYLVAL